jgi:hypothetical protein
MEVGDKVKITGEKTDTGLRLIDYDYIFDDSYEPSSDYLDESSSGAPQPENPLSQDSIINQDNMGGSMGDEPQ